MGLKKKRVGDTLGKPEIQWGLRECQLAVTFTKGAPQGQSELSPKEEVKSLPSWMDLESFKTVADSA